jgi:hypothetical protein
VLVAFDGRHGGGKEQNDGESEERRPLHASCVDGYALGNVTMLQPRTRCFVGRWVWASGSLGEKIQRRQMIMELESSLGRGAHG